MTSKAYHTISSTAVNSVNAAEKCIATPVVLRVLSPVLPLLGLYILRLASITLILKNLLLRVIC